MELKEKEDNNWYLVDDDKETLLDLNDVPGCCPFTQAVIKGLEISNIDEKIIESVRNVFNKHHSYTRFYSYLREKHNMRITNYDYEKHKSDLLMVLDLFDGKVKDYVKKCLLTDIKREGEHSAWSIFYSCFKKKVLPELERELPPQPIVKQKPELNGKLITFKNNETIEKIHSELKGYFPNKEAELLKALQGEQLTEILLFPHNQNKFVEVFRRLKYNGFLLNTDTETKNWICTTFQFIKKGFAEPQSFNENTVWNNLNKGKGEPTKKERICVTEWLPYKSPKQLKEAAQQEKL